MRAAEATSAGIDQHQQLAVAVGKAGHELERCMAQLIAALQAGLRGEPLMDSCRALQAAMLLAGSTLQDSMYLALRD